MSVRQASWRVPAGASPAQVGLSRRLVVSVAWWNATTIAKRTGVRVVCRVSGMRTQPRATRHRPCLTGASDLKADSVRLPARLDNRRLINTECT